MFEWLVQAVLWAFAALFVGIAAVCVTMCHAYWFRAASVIDKKRGEPVNYLKHKPRSDLKTLEKMVAAEEDAAQKYNLQRALDGMRLGQRLLYFTVFCSAICAALHLYFTMWAR
jgi:hypothetical protein